MTTTRQQVQQPKKLTQTQTIENHLTAGKTISTWEAYQQYNITCLAQRVHELRKAGLDIDSELITHDGKTFSIYWIDDKITDNARAILNQLMTQGA